MSGAGDSGAFRRIDLRGERDAIPFSQETRQVGHDHQGFAGHGLFGEAGELEVLGVRQAHDLPTCERIRCSEAQNDAAIAIREKVREEEGRFAEVGTDGLRAVR